MLLMPLLFYYHYYDIFIIIIITANAFNEDSPEQMAEREPNAGLLQGLRRAKRDPVGGHEHPAGLEGVEESLRVAGRSDPATATRDLASLPADRRAARHAESRLRLRKERAV